MAGSEAAFAARMTAMARALGMTSTRFVNASGLPDTRQVTTARDMAIAKLITQSYVYAATFHASSQISG